MNSAKSIVFVRNALKMTNSKMRDNEDYTADTDNNCVRYNGTTGCQLINDGLSRKRPDETTRPEQVPVSTNCFIALGTGSPYIYP